jgi:DNA primase
MLIPEEKVEEILERTDLVALVARSVDLKRAGQTFKGLCPFHGERTPSFTVSPERRRFKCFGCGAGGDAIAFVMRQEGKGFVEAARALAALAGVRLDSEMSDKLARERLELRRVHEWAVRFFSEQLWDTEIGRPGRAHLRARGMKGPTTKAFGLGYAPLSWSALADRAARDGTAALALKAGLLTQGERGRAPHDFFRGRLMIPIRNAEGITVGFGGRVVAGDDSRKFVNSRESAIFRKGDLLFGIHAARDQIRKSGQALLVEGYFDALILHQQGLQNAVALCSSTLTAEQIKLLRRCEAREVVLVLDGDEAGRRGVFRAAPSLLSSAMPCRVVMLPAGKDPDEVVLADGVDKFRQAVAQALPLTEHLVLTVLPEGAAASFERKVHALAELRPILAQIPDGLERSLFLQALSQNLGVPESDLRAHLRGSQKLPPAAPKTAPTHPTKAIDPRLLLEELLLVAHLLVDPDLARTPESAVLEELAHQGLRGLASEQLQAVLDGAARPTDLLLEGLEANLRQRLEATLRLVQSEPAEVRRPEFVEKSRVHRARLARGEEEILQRELGALAREIKARKVQGDDAADLVQEHLRLTEQKRALATARRQRRSSLTSLH